MTGIVQDVTARKREQEALSQSQARLQMAVEAGQMGDWEWDIAHGKVHWSPGLEALHGLAPGMFGGTFEDFQRDVHPDDRERVLAAIARCLEERGDYRVEYRILKPDGAVAWIEARGKLVVDADDQPQLMTGICMDITSRKQAEEALRDETRILEILNDTGAMLSQKLELQELVQAVTDAATALSGARFGAFFYNVTNDSGDSFMLYALSGAPREAFQDFGQPRATPLFGPTFHGADPIRSRRRPGRSALRQVGSASRHAAGSLAGAQLPGRAGGLAIGGGDRRLVLRASGSRCLHRARRAPGGGRGRAGRRGDRQRPHVRSGTEGGRGSQATARKRARGARRRRAHERDEGSVPGHAVARAAHAAVGDPRLVAGPATPGR